MKILYLVSGIGPASGWGTEFIQNFVNELSNKDVEATILNPIYIHTHPSWKQWIRDEYNKYNVRIIPIEVPAFIKNHLFLHFYVTPFIVTYYTFKLLRKEKFDLVHEFSSTPIVLFRTMLIKLFFKIPTIFTLSVLNTSILGSFKWFRIFNFGSYYLIPSREIIQKLIVLGINRSKIIFFPPFIELKSFKKLSKINAVKKLNLPNDKFIFTYYGSLTREKGVMDLIQAIKILPEALKSKILFTFYSIWKGSNEHKKIKETILSLKLSYIKLSEGFTNIPDLLAASDAIILPQQTGFGTTIPPISLIESIAANRPVIATDIVGNREWINSSNGILIEPKNPRSLAQAIVKIYDNRKKYQNLDKNSKTELDVAFNIGNHIKQYLEICTTLITKNEK